MRISSAAGGWIAAALFLAAAASADAPTLEQCEEQVRRAPDERASYLCFREYYQITRDAGVLQRLRGLVAVQPDNALARYVLGWMLSKREPVEAERLLRESADALERQRHPAESNVRALLVWFLSSRMRLDEAEQELARARAARERSGDGIAALEVDYGEASLAASQGNLSRAWLAFRRARLDPDFDRLPAWRQMDFLSRGALAARDLGFLERAYDLANECLAAARQTGRSGPVAVANSTRTVTALSLSQAGLLDPEQALSVAQESLEHARRHGQFIFELEALMAISELARGPELPGYLDELIEMADRTQCWDVAAKTRGYKAGWLSANSPDTPQESLRLLGEALDIAVAHGDPQVWRTLGQIARLRARSGPRTAAIRAFERAVEATENYRLRQPLEELRARTDSTASPLYHSFVGYLLAQDQADFELAFRTSERYRARVLLDHLRRTGEADPPEEIRRLSDERAQKMALIARIQLRLGASMEGNGELDRAGLVQELERLEVEEASLRERMARQAPVAIPGGPEFSGPGPIRRVLSEDEALLSFLVASQDGGGSWMFLLTSETQHAYATNLGPDAESTLRLWLGLMEADDPLEPNAAARSFELIFGQTLASLPETIRHLIVIPDGVLHHVPFAALRRSPADPPLGAEFSFSLVPSATFWLRARESDLPRARGRALVLADPELPGSEGDAESRSVLLTGGRLQRLPLARDEGRTVLAAVDSGTLLFGAAASEAFLKDADFESYGIVHFAAHAVLDEQRVERSAIVLARGGGVEDGLVQPREVQELPLRHQLVTLAACRSGSGPVLGGEGVMSLARSFLQAGAGTVVASLWPLRDDDARELFGAFYAGIGRGQSVADALTLARRARIDSGAPPSAWAGVVAIGDGDLRFDAVDQNFRPLTLAALSVLGLSVLVLLYWTRRR